jgi:hypothetical protein
MNRTYLILFLAILTLIGNIKSKDTNARLQYEPLSLQKRLPPQIQADPYVNMLLKKIDNWNNTTIEFPPTKVLRGQFDTRVKAAVAHEWHGYESRAWAEGKLQQFDNLVSKPNHPQLKMDREAAMTLSLAFAINLPFIHQRLTPESLDKELSISLYPVLIDAQARALKANRNYISSEDISSTIFNWWTTVYPLCAPPVKSIK